MIKNWQRRRPFSAYLAATLLVLNGAMLAAVMLLVLLTEAQAGELGAVPPAAAVVGLGLAVLLLRGAQRILRQSAGWWWVCLLLSAYALVKVVAVQGPGTPGYTAQLVISIVQVGSLLWPSTIRYVRDDWGSRLM